MQDEVERTKKYRLNLLIDKVRLIFNTRNKVWCPYFRSHICLNADGLNHLLNKPNRIPRNINEQILKLSLVSKALTVISNSGTLQELREKMEKIGEKTKDGFYKMKRVKYWAFHAILGEEKLIKIVVVIKRAGDGQLMFWSVLPHKKFNNQKLYSAGLEDE